MEDIHIQVAKFSPQKEGKDTVTRLNEWLATVPPEKIVDIRNYVRTTKNGQEQVEYIVVYKI